MSPSNDFGSLNILIGVWTLNKNKKKFKEKWI